MRSGRTGLGVGWEGGQGKEGSLGLREVEGACQVRGTEGQATRQKTVFLLFVVHATWLMGS